MQVPDKFKCKLCKNAYAYEGILKTHVMIAHCKIKSYGDKSHKCNQWDYASTRAGTLREDLKTHSEENCPNATNVTFHLFGKAI